MLTFLPTLVTIVYIGTCIIMILVILLQAGRGGMGALGGAASQSVFGSSGGADFLAKVTQACAAGFMLCALFLAYASTHTGSERLQSESERLAGEDHFVESDEDVDYERVGPNPLPLPSTEAPVAGAQDSKATEPTPPPSDAEPVDAPDEDTPTPVSP